MADAIDTKKEFAIKRRILRSLYADFQKSFRQLEVERNKQIRTVVEKYKKKRIL